MKPAMFKTTMRRGKSRNRLNFDEASATMSSGGEERISRNEWYKHNKEKIQAEDLHKFEKFCSDIKSYMKKALKKDDSIELNIVKKEELKSAFQIKDDELFEIFYSLVCPSSRESVDLEQTMIMLYIFMRNNGSDEEFAFRLFSTQPQLGENVLYKREFAEMIVTIVDNNLNKMFEVLKGREAFFIHLQKEHSEELFLFHEQILPIIKERTVKVDKARVIFQNYLEIGGKFEINISHPLRESIRQCIEAAEANAGKKKAKATMTTAVFQGAVDEVVEMLQGGFQRFKRKLVKDNSLFVDVTWSALQIPKAEETMSYDKFTKWCKKNPTVFDCLDKIQGILLRAYGEKIGNVVDLVKPSTV